MQMQCGGGVEEKKKGKEAGGRWGKTGQGEVSAPKLGTLAVVELFNNTHINS